MKIVCTSCGIHFPEEFEDTLKRKCSFWSDRGLKGLPRIYREQIWTWIFSLNTDEIFLRSHYAIGVSVQGRKVPRGKKFADIPEYRAMTEEERRRFQKVHHKAKEMGI